MCPVWSPPYKIRRSTRILSYAINQLQSALNLMGEPVYLLKRMSRANAPTVQKDNRRVSTISQTVSSYSTDVDTGYLRALIWNENINNPTEYPDQGVFTATVTASGGTDVWEKSVDKYSFIGTMEYAFDEYRNERYDDGTDRPHEVYVVFNTPPMTISNSTILTYGIANPQTKFESMQILKDNELPDFGRSLFGYQQWYSSTSRVRGTVQPNAFLLCWPALDSDITITDGGLLQDSRIAHWTNPEPYAPTLSEHDIIVRISTGQRYQIVNFRKIFIEAIYVQQQFDLVELDPRSSCYQIPVIIT